MFQDADVWFTIELLFCAILCNILACVEEATNSVTVDTVLLEAWKKYSINPAPNNRCIPRITATYIILCLPVKSINKSIYFIGHHVFPLARLTYLTQVILYVFYIYIFLRQYVFYLRLLVTMIVVKLLRIKMSLVWLDSIATSQFELSIEKLLEYKCLRNIHTDTKALRVLGRRKTEKQRFIYVMIKKIYIM